MSASAMSDTEIISLCLAIEGVTKTWIMEKINQPESGIRFEFVDEPANSSVVILDDSMYGEIYGAMKFRKPVIFLAWHKRCLIDRYNLLFQFGIPSATIDQVRAEIIRVAHLASVH